MTASGELVPLDVARLERIVREACSGLADVAPDAIVRDALRGLFDGIPQADVATALIMSARPLIEREPNYTYVTARLLLDVLRREALTFLEGRAQEATQAEMAERYSEYFVAFVAKGIELGLLDPRLGEFDLDAACGRTSTRARPCIHVPRVANALRPLFLAVAKRAFRAAASHVHARRDGARVERGRPRSASDRVLRSIELVRLHELHADAVQRGHSSGRSSRAAISTTVPDDLDGIYGAIRDNALLSKFAGGLGNDWSRVRALGAHIKGTNGKSQGVVPFLKVANDTAVAVNQGGKRKGAVCAYLATWHLDVEEFLELRKNTGDERRRTHDMHTAHWIPDLFMRRVAADGGLDVVLARRGSGFARSLRPRRSTAPTKPTSSAPSAASSRCGSASRLSSSGAGCCRCSSRRGIRGSRSRIRATCARRSSTWAPCTARTSAPRSR